MSTKLLSAFFAVAMVVFAAVSTPPQVIIHYAFDRNVVSYRAVSGSLFDLAFRDVVISGFAAKRLEVETKPLSLLTGAPAIDGRFATSDGSGTFSAVLDGDTIEFSELSVVYGVNADSAFGALNGALRLESANAIISMKTGCRSGRFDLTSDVITQAMSEFGVEQPPLIGYAECMNDGMLVMELTSLSDFAAIKAMGRIDTRQNWSNPEFMLTYTMSSPNGLAFPRAVSAALEGRGLQKSGEAYSGNLLIRPE